jgi:L-asparaginase/Glu-tRNA(Gln) amidotransferase subunit D
MTRLYEPVVLGKGVTIKSKPSDPMHAVRVTDLKEYAKMQRVDFVNETAISVPRLAENNIVQVYDSNSQAFTPERLEQLTDTIEVEFLVPETGYMLIFSVGEL